MSAADAFMGRAIACAEKAAALGEVPVGAVVVRDGKVIATGYNKREKGKNALLHAEIIAIHRACRKLGSWRLSDCDLYVTLEPCPMCTGAIINSRMRRVYIGAMDPKAGCMGSVCDLTAHPFNHRPEIVYGILEDQCATLLSDFFGTLRTCKKLREEPISLRCFTQDDASVLKRYLFPNRAKKDILSTIQGWNSGFQEDVCSKPLAVTADGHAVGYIELEVRAGGKAVGAVHIFPGFRGKGYGGQALLQLISLAQKKGYDTIEGWIRPHSTPALRLCQRAGFLCNGEEKTENGILLRCMRLSLKKQE